MLMMIHLCSLILLVERGKGNEQIRELVVVFKRGKVRLCERAGEHVLCGARSAAKRARSVA